MAACMMSSVSLMLAGVSSQFSFFVGWLFMAGFGFSGLEAVGRVYLSEISGPNFKINSTAVLNSVWALSQIFLVLLLSVVKYWRYVFFFFMGLLFLVSVSL